MAGHHHHKGIRRKPLDLPGQRQAASVRQFEIHQDKIGDRPAADIHRLAFAFRLGDLNRREPCIQNGFHHLTKRSIVLHEHNMV